MILNGLLPLLKRLSIKQPLQLGSSGIPNNSPETVSTGLGRKSVKSQDVFLFSPFRPALWRSHFWSAVLRTAFRPVQFRVGHHRIMILPKDPGAVDCIAVRNQEKRIEELKSSLTPSRPPQGRPLPGFPNCPDPSEKPGDEYRPSSLTRPGFPEIINKLFGQ